MRPSRRPTTQPRLRKQPKMRRLEAAAFVAQPKLQVPKTARKRQRRNFRRVHLPVAGIKQVIFSARWVSMLLLAMVVYALILIGLDEQFYVTTIPVDGANAIPAAEIVTASQLARQHIFAADPAGAAAGILGVPGVLSATVTVRWPNQVHIQVKENSPTALWVEGNNQFWVMSDGRLLPARADVLGLLMIEAEGVEATAVPATTGAETPAPSTANTAFVPADVLAGALQLKALRPNIDRLYFQPGNGLSYQDGRGWRAYFGSGLDMEQKLVVYETIVEQLQSQGITPAYVSVANQERPFYRSN
ncbi:MAG: FtsQ-type POTRA domain-containing protein [Anaerolineae bacterium]|nr:FtsQ-type POTRA domain-containing protein [Anaerolineae bacterium]